MICGRGPREWASFLFCSAPVDWGARTASACSSPNGRAFFAYVRELVQSGAIGQIACSRVATGRKNYLTYEIRGTMGSVRYDLERMGAAWTK